MGVVVVILCSRYDIMVSFVLKSEDGAKLSKLSGDIPLAVYHD